MFCNPDQLSRFGAGPSLILMFVNDNLHTNHQESIRSTWSLLLSDKQDSLKTERMQNPCHATKAANRLSSSSTRSSTGARVFTHTLMQRQNSKCWHYQRSVCHHDLPFAFLRLARILCVASACVWLCPKYLMNPWTNSDETWTSGTWLTFRLVVVGESYLQHLRCMSLFSMHSSVFSQHKVSLV